MAWSSHHACLQLGNLFDLNYVCSIDHTAAYKLQDNESHDPLARAKHVSRRTTDTSRHERHCSLTLELARSARSSLSPNDSERRPPRCSRCAASLPPRRALHSALISAGSLRYTYAHSPQWISQTHEHTILTTSRHCACLYEWMSRSSRSAGTTTKSCQTRTQQSRTSRMAPSCTSLSLCLLRSAMATYDAVAST